MLARFSLYGFLKNQRYFEPFLLLAFLDKGLSFFAIGGLIAFREIATTLLEIPSGSVADLLGRRRSMVVAFAGYVCSFLLFWLASEPWLLVPAMLMFSVGEAFRTGTHKAMIFAWLRLQGRTSEKTKVYGYTRSWSKLGSATSAVVGAAPVFWLDDLSAVFWLSAIPAGLNLINLCTYPAELDGAVAEGCNAPIPRSTTGDVLRHSWAAVRSAVRRPQLRNLLGESMAFEGLFHACKDYLQPLLAGAAMAIWMPIYFGPGFQLAEGSRSELQNTTLLIGPIYLVVHLLSAVASRQAHRVVTALGGDEGRATRMLWSATAAVFAGMLYGALTQTYAVMIAAFVLLHIAQNIWRPVLISRMHGLHGEGASAVGLSVESQARRVATMIMAPLLGLAVDYGQEIWPIAAFGLALAVAMRVRSSIHYVRSSQPK